MPDPVRLDHDKLVMVKQAQNGIVLKCLGCGAEAVLGLPLKVGDFTVLVNAFVDRHERHNLAKEK